jgi:hypothetical protein
MAKITKKDLYLKAIAEGIELYDRCGYSWI